MSPKKSISLRGPSALLAMMVAALVVGGGSLWIAGTAVAQQNFWLLFGVILWVIITAVPAMILGIYAGAAFNKYIRGGRDTKPESDTET